MESLAEESLLTLDFLDPEGSAAVVASFHERYPVDAIVSVDEETAVVASAIGEALALPHNAPEAANRARLKHEMRRALAAAGVPGPEFRVVDAGEGPRAVAREVRYPAVIKPVFLAGSRGVRRVDDEDALVAALEWTRGFLSQPDLAERGGEHARRILVEEYVPGDEVALEGLVTDGELEVLALFDKPDPLEGPFFEETIYVTPSRLPRERQDQIVDVAARAAAALGLGHGPVHAELRLPPEGEPSVIEIAGRSIGGLCSRTLRFGLQMSLEELILRHALGHDVSELTRESHAAGVMMIPIPRAGVLEEVVGLDEAKAVAAIEDVTITAPVGRELVPLPEGSSYLGFIFARAETPAAAEAALRRAHAKLGFAIS
jgi:biotin carboxylase